MASPNSEQLKAIEHFGGVLLKAGAGSGKTFVLKEHMLFLASNWIKSALSEGKTEEEFKLQVRSNLRKIILMTFTKKAAGELEIRIKNEFLAKLDDTDLNEKQRDFWRVISEQLDCLNVSTIHGFCFKLIKMGFFPGVSSDQEMLSEFDYNLAIDKILEKYFNDYIVGKDDFISILLIREKRAIVDSFKGIFSDPSLRKAWQSQSVCNMNDSLDMIVTEIISTQNLSSIFESSIILSEEEQKTKWGLFLNEFLSQSFLHRLTFENFVKICHFFKNIDYKMPVTPRAKAVPESIKDFYKQVKLLKDFIKKNADAFVLYEQHGSHHIQKWYQEIKKIYDFVDAEFEKVEGVTFSDLEYIVYKGLKDKAVSNRILEEFNYFIVDEFQDTSYIQFDILNQIIQGDFSKLFCVGDLKQAIYGFRGGELGVFQECETKMPSVLSLKNNYRSAQNIINFNNVFFEYLFTKGLGFQGEDKHSVEVEYQSVPETQDVLGEIVKIRTSLADFAERKISNSEIDTCEAYSLVEGIKKRLEEDSADVAVLYKRLKPSLPLIKKLMIEKISFTAQLKIKFDEDPVVSLFLTLLEYKFNNCENKKELFLIQFETILRIVLRRNDFHVSINDLIDKYNYDINNFGLYQAFNILLSKLKVANSNYKNNLEVIRNLIDLANGDELNLYSIISTQDRAYSLDFQYGERPDRINIMTAHASKGLQFKHVFLGGIYTNDNIAVKLGFIGKLPFSFKWSLSHKEKTNYKTPHYMFEELIAKQKEFSENKRLFYVANTRAEKTLQWVEFDFDEIKRSKASNGSWIEGIKVWEQNKKNFSNITSYDVDLDFETIDFTDNQPPLFHTDSLGLTSSLKENQFETILPELSVTRLSMLAQCPKKFYLANICKISPDDIQETLEEFDKESELISLEEISKNGIRIKSNASRGSEIHEMISQVIVDDFSFESTHDLLQKYQHLSVVVDNLKEIAENSELISERPIKFELLSYMISGIPDLIIKGFDFEVWDFKTGKSKEEAPENYLFQLYCYAYAQYYFDELPKDRQIKLVIYYVDENKKLEFSVSYSDVEKYLLEKIKLSLSPEIENISHCEDCYLKQICQK